MRKCQKRHTQARDYSGCQLLRDGSKSSVIGRIMVEADIYRLYLYYHEKA